VAALRRLWSGHGVALLLYTLLSAVLTWPLLPNFRTALTGFGDSRHHLWLLWHAKEAFLGREPLFSTSLLYYPHGTTLLSAGQGPLVGLFALPFWPLGREAAYNGAVLISFALTGYGMYLLARGLGLERGISLFAGTMFMVAPMHTAAVGAGHLGKVFLGLLPLALLCLHHTLDPARSRWWTVATAVAFALTLLHSGNQFVLAGLAAVFFVAAALIRAGRAGAWPILKRVALAGLLTLLLTAPILLQLAQVLGDPTIATDNNLESFQFQPDLLQLFLPSRFTSRLLGWPFADFLNPYILEGIETAIFLSWVGLALALLAVIKGRRSARVWALLALLFALLSLGPTLKVMGDSQFTEYDLAIPLPYAFLTALPGFDSWRTPGRFMLVGYVSLAVAASFGLAWLVGRTPHKWRWLVIAGAIALVALENWPRPWAMEALPPVPPFYQQIAHDDEVYGVFDLPIRPYQDLGYLSLYYTYSSYYEMHQMVHGKGIAAGYLGRNFIYHPLFPHIINNAIPASPLQRDALVNGQPANRYANVLYNLARFNYRYVVWHKPHTAYVGYTQDSWGEESAAEFIETAFGHQPPMVKDEYATVYAVPPLAEAPPLTTTIALWESPEQSYLDLVTGSRWGISTATYYVASPQTEVAYLETIIGQIEPGRPATATLVVESGGHISSSIPISVGHPFALPFILAEGEGTLTLTVESPLTLEEPPDEVYFALESVNLRTTGWTFPSPDLRVDGQPQVLGDGLVAVHGDGWYQAEGPAWRWAASPAELLLYSDASRSVRLEMTPGALYDPGAEDGMGRQGTMLIQVNDGQQQQMDVHLDEPCSLEVAFRAGWNRLTLALEADNFRPSDVQPGNGDQRLLSFALAGINLRTR
jgi:hypothetical protein